MRALIKPLRLTPLIKPRGFDPGRRALITGAAALAAYAAYPRDANATFQRIARGGGSGGGGASYPLGVTAAGLQAVWDSQTNGTVGNTSAPNVTSPSYITGLGAVLDFAGDPSYYFFANATVNNFDFTAGSRPVYVDGTGIVVTFNNCKFGHSSSLNMCLRPGGNTGLSINAKAILNNCDVTVDAFSMPNGKIETHFTNFHDSLTSQYFFAGNSAGTYDIQFFDTVMTMGTSVPVSGTHMEFGQFGGVAQGSTFAATRCVFNVEGTKNTDYAPSDAGWSGVLSSGALNTLTDCIFAGVKQVNDNFTNRVANSFNYNRNCAPVLNNCVLGNGPQGRAHFSRQPGDVDPPDLPSAAGGVYDFDTGALCNPVN